MKKFGTLAAAFAILAVLSACSDAGTLPVIKEQGIGAASTRPMGDYVLEPVIVVGEPSCDPYLQLDFSCAGDDCMTSTSGEPDDFQAVAGCTGGTTGGGTGGTTGGGGGGTGTPSPTPTEDPFEDGPILFGQCFVAMLGVLAGTAAMLPTTDGIYQAAREHDSAKRMLQVVIQNGGDAQTQALWEFRVEYARNRYNDAVGSFALAAGFTAIAVGGAAVACLPAALLPTP